MTPSGVPRPELTLRIHVRILAEPLHYSIGEMVDAARRVFATAGVRIEVASRQTLARPELSILMIGECVRGIVTDHQRLLFAERDGVPPGEFVVYFVRSTVPRRNGCAAHPEGLPAAVVAKRASRWTLAHEIGHVLGLDHVGDTRRLMVGKTLSLTKFPPELVPREIGIIRASPLLR